MIERNNIQGLLNHSATKRIQREGDDRLRGEHAVHDTNGNAGKKKTFLGVDWRGRRRKRGKNKTKKT
jgi:hypothetical protein